MADQQEGGQQQDSFNALLVEMPRIAEAVQAFPEAVQAQALEALLAAATGGTGTTTSGRTPVKRRIRKPGTNVSGGAVKSGPRRKSAPSAMRELDLTPKGKPSLKNFVAEKQPKTNHDKNVLSVYYLEETLKISSVTLDHVFTCYKDARWRESPDLANSLALTAYKKRFLNTANLNDIKLTPPGRNHVEHDLPPKKKGA